MWLGVRSVTDIEEKYVTGIIKSYKLLLMHIDFYISLYHIFTETMITILNDGIANVKCKDRKNILLLSMV